MQENEEIKSKMQDNIDHTRTFELRKGTVFKSLVKVKYKTINRCNLESQRKDIT